MGNWVPIYAFVFYPWQDFTSGYLRVHFFNHAYPPPPIFPPPSFFCLFMKFVFYLSPQNPISYLHYYFGNIPYIYFFTYHGFSEKKYVLYILLTRITRYTIKKKTEVQRSNMSVNIISPKTFFLQN